MFWVKKCSHFAKISRFDHFSVPQQSEIDFFFSNFHPLLHIFSTLIAKNCKKKKDENSKKSQFSTSATRKSGQISGFKPKLAYFSQNSSLNFHLFRMPTTSTEAQSSSSKNQDRCRSFSQELGVDDEPEEQQAPVATPKQTKKAQKTAKTTEEVKSPRKSARKSELKKPEPEEKAKEPRKSASKRKSSSLMNKDEPSTSTEAPSADVPGTSEASDEASEIQEAPENPNSALAIKKRLMGGGESSKSAPTKNPPKARKSNVKKPEKEAEALAPPEPPAEPQEAAETPAPEPLVPEKKPKIEDAPTTSSPKKSTPTSAPPTRASARVSKPNRLYADGSFNTEILGRTRITEQNPVKEVRQLGKMPYYTMFSDIFCCKIGVKIWKIT